MTSVRVFVVDDNEASASSVEALLESIGMTVELYNSAEAFLEAYRPDQPSVLVLDVRLPGMNGLDLQDHLSASRSDIHIVFISGHADDATAALARQGGAVACLAKPFDGLELCEIVCSSVAQLEMASDAAKLAAPPGISRRSLTWMPDSPTLTGH